MSSSSINISWEVSPRFEQVKLEGLLRSYSATERDPTSEYELGFWQVNGITLKLYSKKLVAQGRNTSTGVRIVHEIKKLNGLSVDQKNRVKLLALKPVSQNALICDECSEYVYLINSNIEGLDISFKNECGHTSNVSAPFMMGVNRIMPDINILKSRNFSRMIELGFFENCEILLPDYLMKCIDHYMSGSTATVSSEIEELRELEKQGLVTIKPYKDGFTIPASRDEFNIEEDPALIDIADITNSIFITADINCKDQAILRKRPVIFIDHETTKNTKILHELRTASE